RNCPLRLSMCNAFGVRTSSRHGFSAQCGRALRASVWLCRLTACHRSEAFRDPAPSPRPSPMGRGRYLRLEGAAAAAGFGGVGVVEGEAAFFEAFVEINRGAVEIEGAFLIDHEAHAVAVVLRIDLFIVLLIEAEAVLKAAAAAAGHAHAQERRG